MKRKVLITTLIIIFSMAHFSYCAKPDISAQSAVLMHTQSGRVLLEYNPHIRLPMASTTKIMTALVALEKGNLGDRVHIGSDSVGIEGSSIYLSEDEVLSLEDLLYGLMLRSGNDSSVAIAKHIGKTQQNFNTLMNEKARQIGANNTHFMNPHGLHDDNHYSTAYDMALITRTAMNIDDFKKITSTRSWQATRTKNNLFYNKNKTLWEYEGGDGVKTGYTQRAGRCLVSSATRYGTQLIAVVLNDRNWFEDSYRLMNYGFENFNNYVIVDQDQYIRNINVSSGNKDSTAAIVEQSFLYPLREDELEAIRIDINLPQIIEAPIRKGEPIGEITVFLDSKIIHIGNIIAVENVKRLGYIRRMIERIKD
ncbi:MAG: D-alanyl-D-alanine carboxypeptidase [Tissierellia bacterium]|nr:D-alanyl-D-alanine carboxypeptidase [Tissierellia bacterium]